MNSQTPAHVPLLDLKREFAALQHSINARLTAAMAHQEWILGPEVREFEGEFGKMLKVEHAIGTSSGTEALLLALRALALKQTNEEYWTKHDEVVTTSFSFTATGDTILRAGATPVFLDIDPLTYNIDLDLLEKYVTVSSRVRALVIVHLFGRSVDMDRVKRIAASRNIPIVEDVAQACGSRWGEQQCGAMGTVGAFSFFPSKNLGAFGDAGLVTTNDSELAELIRMLCRHGGKDKYDVQHIGYNARLDTLQAAILLGKLPFLADFNSRRRGIASRYSSALGGLSGIETPPDEQGHVYHQYTIRVHNELRDPFKRFLDTNQIGSAVYYPVPLHRMRVFDGRSIVPAPCPEAERAAREVLSLPIEPLLEPWEIERVLSLTRAFFQSAHP
jgi:dTDP-4-amino-4,6-dideoxygalactose transaminase